MHLTSCRVYAILKSTNHTYKEKAIMEKNVTVWFNSPQVKILPRSHMPWGKRESYHIYVAKNSSEGVQVSFMAPEARGGFSIEIVGAKECGVKVELLREMYVSCAGAEHPDPVLPDDGKFDLEKMRNLTYLINFVTDDGSVAGEHSLKMILKEGGEIYGEYEITLTVWNFSIDRSSPMDTSFGIQREFLELCHKSEDPDGLYKKYYDMLLDRYHICAYSLPYDILDERVDEYLNDDRVTTFIIPYDVDDDTIRAYYAKLSSNEKWMKKGFFYVIDEPCNMEAYAKIEASHKRLEQLFPNYQAVSPFFQDPDDAPGVRAVDMLEKFCSIWCPKINLYKDQWFVDYMHDRDARGDKSWWYVCWEPLLPYANVFVDMEGFYHRVLFWQQFLHDVRGMLYWSTVYWVYTNPWDSASTVENLSYYCFGDGSMFYPGDRVDIDGPVGSLRLEILRYGIDDFYMLRQAEEKFGREWVDEQIKTVSPNVREYNDDHSMLDKVRVIIGERLSKE